MQSFKITKRLEAICDWEKTGYGFKHTAVLLMDGIERVSAKCCYYNRTWERYEYESVLKNLLEKSRTIITGYERHQFKKTIRTGGKREAERMDSLLKTTGMIAAMGSIFHAEDQKASNDWKARMLKAGLGNLGLIMPDDWDQLDEDTKTARLDAVIAHALKKDE